jgi:hypothetical protein
MKAKVIMPFKDKATGKVHKVGDVIECVPARLAEIKKAGRFVVEVKEETATKVEEKK